MNRLPGEIELLEYIRTFWHYGGTYEQIESGWNPPKESASLQELLSILVALGEINKSELVLFYPLRIKKPDQISSTPSKD